MSSVLCLYFILRTPTARAIIVLMKEENVRICPATPIETVNVALISINRRPRRVPGGSIGAEESIIDRRVVLLLASDSPQGIAYTFLTVDFIKIQQNLELQ